MFSEVGLQKKRKMTLADRRPQRWILASSPDIGNLRKGSHIRLNIEKILNIRIYS